MKIQITTKTNWLSDLAGAWLFYTILPEFPFIKAKFSRIVRFAPFIGIFIGAIQSITWIILTQTKWPLLSSVLISISIGVVLTGGIHIDGLIDTADGIGAGPSKCFKAMKDSRVGAIGLQALLLVIIIQIAALIKLQNLAPFAFPIAAFWGRFSQILAVGNFKYISQEGKSSFHKKYWQGNIKEVAPSIILISLIILILLLIPNALIGTHKLLFFTGILLNLVPTVLIPALINKKVGGHNGDTYGASLVLVETISLLILSCFWN